MGYRGSKRGVNILTLPFKLGASTTLTGGEVVVLGTNADEVALSNDDANCPVGVNVSDATHNTQNDSIPVRVAGTAVVVAAGAITKGAKVHVVDALGRVDDTAPGTLGDWYVGVALEAASAVGDEIEILISRALYAAS